MAIFNRSKQRVARGLRSDQRMPLFFPKKGFQTNELVEPPLNVVRNNRRWSTTFKKYVWDYTITPNPLNGDPMGYTYRVVHNFDYNNTPAQPSFYTNDWRWIITGTTGTTDVKSSTPGFIYESISVFTVSNRNPANFSTGFDINVQEIGPDEPINAVWLYNSPTRLNTTNDFKVVESNVVIDDDFQSTPLVNFDLYQCIHNPEYYLGWFTTEWRTFRKDPILANGALVSGREEWMPMVSDGFEEIGYVYQVGPPLLDRTNPITGQHWPEQAECFGSFNGQEVPGSTPDISVFT